MERWNAIEDTYHAARGLSDEDRSRLLDERCGSDLAMRRQIDALLAQDSKLAEFLDRPALESAHLAAGRLAGLRVGVYEVLEPIGAGGMGEVYRARDTRLGRDVALKALPGFLALDADRLKRFDREAQILASLNHPNIAAIYGFEESAGVRALVLELVEGLTLAERIAQGPVPADDAIAIARQIADALAAAHERGVVHRDLKPANIKVRPDGLVKVLDFGLAKAFEPVGGFEPFGAPSTSAPVTTRVGIVLGTAAYMSPEQATGAPADARADVWAFGCVLYEMLTGTRAFGGEDVSEILGAVQRAEPDWHRIPDAVPASVRVLIEGCLRKDRRQSLTDISAARFLLGDRQIATYEPRQTPQRWARWRRAMPFVATAAAAAGIATWAASVSRPRTADTHAVQFPVAAPRGTAFGTREQGIWPAISPDGSRLVFKVMRRGESVLAVRPIDALDAQVLTGTEGARFPFWSPDSRTVAFFAGGKLETVNAAGGAIHFVCDAPQGWGGSWSRRGVIVFAPGSATGLFRVAETGGSPSAVTTIGRKETSHRFPQFLPDGRRFLYFSPPDSVYLGSIDDRSVVGILHSDRGARYALPGYLLFNRGDTLFAERFDIDRAHPTGEPTQVGDGLVAFPGSGETAFSASDNGMLAYAMTPADDVRLAWVDRNGKPVQTIGPFPFGRYAAPELSPDATRIAMESVPASLGRAAPWANQDVWVVDDRGALTQLTFDPASDEHPIWSPDGNQIVFFSRRPNAPGLYRKTIRADTPEEPLLRGEHLFPSDWSTRGVAYDSGGDASDIWLLPLDGRKPIPLVEDRGTQMGARFSPDESWFAYQSDELGSSEIFVKSFPPTARKWWLSTAGGSQPRWRRDGKELFYLAPDGKLMAVPISTGGSTFHAGAPHELFPTGLHTLYPRLRSYGVSKDGDRFLLTLLQDPTTTPTIVVVSNWPARVAR